MMTVRKLGKQGRFANSLFQYAHLRQRAGTDYECPRWSGRYAFGLNDPLPTGQAHDIGTRFPYEASWYDKELFRSLFIPVEIWQDRARRWYNSIRSNGSCVVGIHLRRGDYGTFKRKSARWCFRAPVQWYLDWLKDNADKLGIHPQVYIASDDLPAVLPAFKGYKVFCFNPTEGMSAYFYDFFTLIQCDYLLISNSTFSFAASMLNERAHEFWRPRLSEERLIPYDPWNSKIVLKDELYAV